MVKDKCIVGVEEWDCFGVSKDMSISILMLGSGIELAFSGRFSIKQKGLTDKSWKESPASLGCSQRVCFHQFPHLGECGAVIDDSHQI